MQSSKKIWWMNISETPERIFLSKTCKESDIETVFIKMKFDFGEIELEKIQSFPLEGLIKDNLSEFTVTSNTIDLIPEIVRTEMCADISSLGILIDSIVTSDTEAILLNRKLVPYQCSISSVTKDAQNLKRRKDLIRYITLLLENANISVKNNEIESDESLHQQFSELDKIGVAYIIIINEKSEENGLLGLRNRDTGLSEIIHVSDIPNYLLKLL